jgi:hypothetical protein
VKASPSTNTTYTVTAKFTSSGCQNTATSIITVKPKPAITATFVNPTTCGGTNGSITLSGLAVSTAYTLNYAKNGVPITPVSRTSSTTGTIVISSLSSGSYTNINVTLNGCVSNSIGLIVLVNPLPPTLSIPGDLTVCTGVPTGTITFSAVPSTSTIRWTNNNTSIGLGSSGTGSIASFTAVNNSTAVQTATVSVTAIANACTSAAKTMRIIVNPRPQITVNSASVCRGDSATLSVTGSANSFSWSPITALSSSTGSVVKAAPTSTTTYTVTAGFTATSCKNTASSTVTVKTKPAITATFVNPSSCSTATGSITLSGLAASTAYTLNYAKNGVSIAPVSRTSSTTGTIIISSLTVGLYTNINVTLNGCVSNTISSITLSNSSQPAKPTITQSGTSLISSSTTGNQWYLNNNLISGATTQNITPSQSGNYTVIATINSCASPVSNPYSYTVPAQRNTLYTGEKIKLYPNPFTSSFKISYLFSDNTQEVDVKIFNTTGALIKEYKRIKSDETIKGDHLPNGNLIIVIETKSTMRLFLYKLFKN